MYYRLATLIRVIAVALVTGLGTLAQAETRLMMAEEPGCIWCARWNEEIGHIYPKTDEGRTAPLRRVDISLALPDDITLARRVSFTPTFILLIDGTETARLEGYPGEDFFWGLIAQMLEEHAEAIDGAAG